MVGPAAGVTIGPVNKRQERAVDSSLTKVYRDATRAAVLGLAINLCLGLVKLVGGIVGSSFALISDSINSLGDSAASIISITSLRIAQKPADDDHPYGHARAEASGSLTVAILFIAAALLVGWQAIARLNTPRALPAVWTLWIAGANMLIKEALYQYNVRVGKRTQSSLIVANAWDHRGDALCSAAALVGLMAVYWGGSQFLWADEAASLVIVSVIVCVGIHLYVSSASELLDPQADDHFVGRIRTAAETIHGVHAVEKLWVRKTGLEYHVDIHIEVDATITVHEGHEIGHHVKDHLLSKYDRIRDVLVHLEPFEDAGEDLPGSP